MAPGGGGARPRVAPPSRPGPAGARRGRGRAGMHGQRPSRGGAGAAGERREAMAAGAGGGGGGLEPPRLFVALGGSWPFASE